MPHMAVADQDKLNLIDKLERLTETGRRLKVQAKEETNLYAGAAVTGVFVEALLDPGIVASPCRGTPQR